MDSTHLAPLVANGTRVGEIFSVAGVAFQKMGELAMLLHGNREAGSIPQKTQAKLHHSLKRFATDLEHISSDIKRKTEDQILNEVRRKYEEERPDSSPSKQRRPTQRGGAGGPGHSSAAAASFSPPRQQLSGPLNEAERIMAQAEAERSAMLAGMPPPPDDGLMDEGTIVEEEIITTETDDGAVSDSGPVRGIGVAGSGESSSGEDEGLGPSRLKKRGKKRKPKRNEFMIGALRVGGDEDDEDDRRHHPVVVQEDHHHHQHHHHSDLMSDQHIDIGLEESIEVTQTEEEVVHDGLELQFGVTEEEVVTT